MKITKDSVLCKIQRVNNDRKNTSDSRIITDYNEMHNGLEMLDKAKESIQKLITHNQIKKIHNRNYGYWY